MTDRQRALMAIGVVACAVALIVYGGTLHFDLFWDDYGTLKPRTWTGLLRVWHSSWDAGPPFYRPLATWYFALCFELFGLNAVPLHILSIVEIAMAALLTGEFVRRETHSVAAGAFAAAVFAAHPGTAFATGPFFADQFHLLATFATLGALLAWQTRQHDPPAKAWWPIAAWVTIGFLVKEDTLMVAPAVLLAQFVRARWVRDVPAPTRRLWLQAAVWAGALVAWRWYCVATLGRYQLPSLAIGVANLARGPYRVLLLFPHDSIARWAVAVFLVSAVVAGGWLSWRREAARAGGLWLTGAALFVCANLPLVLVSNMSRYHLLTLASTLMVTAGMAGLRAMCSSMTARRALTLVFAIGLIALGVSSRDALVEYRPCTPANLERDRDILPWDLAPIDAREWLSHKPEACASGTYRPITESIDFVRWQVSPNQLVALISRNARAATVTVRVAGASEAAPVRLVVSADGGRLTTVSLTSDQWIDVTAPLAPAGLSWLRRMFWLELRADGRTSTPSRLSVGNVRIE